MAISYAMYGGKLKVSQIKHFLHSSYGKKNDLNNHDGYLVDKDLSGSRFQAYYHPEKNIYLRYIEEHQEFKI